MSTPSPLDEDLAPERLTETLRRSGGLDGGRVAEITVETSRTTLISTIQRLRLRYEAGAGPATLIRKQPRGDIDATLRGLVACEFGFYTIVAPATPPGGLMRCYGILGVEDGPRSLLLEDLTDSHDRQRVAPAADARAVRAHHGHLRRLPRALVGRPSAG